MIMDKRSKKAILMMESQIRALLKEGIDVADKEKALESLDQCVMRSRLKHVYLDYIFPAEERSCK